MQKKTKIFIYIAIIITILAIILLPKLLNNNKADSANPTSNSSKKAMPVTVQVIRPTTLYEDINAVGTLIADESVELNFETSGKITHLYFHEGDFVKQGTLLAKVNDAPLVSELLRLQADTALLVNRYERRKALYKTEAISKDEFDAAFAELNKLRANIAFVQANIDKCKLVAPFDGVIGLRNISEGAFASVGTNVALLTKTDHLKIEFDFPEQYVEKIGKGTEIEFQISNDTTIYKATIYAIDASIDQQTKALKARARFNNTQYQLTPGRFANVTVKLGEKTNTLTVPSEAVTMVMGDAILYKYKNGLAFTEAVSIGTRNEKELEIISGLSSNDTIIVKGIMQLRNGSNVKITEVE